MAVDYPYTTEVLVTSLVGRLGIELRLDDSGDPGDDMDWAIDTGTVEVDFYLSRYSQVDLAASVWAQTHATWFATRALCQRRLNDVPASVKEECDRREKLLMLVLQRKVDAPRLAKTRRPVAVTNYHTDLRKLNNQIRVDRSKSTGVAEDYRRPTDNAPDDR